MIDKQQIQSTLLDLLAIPSPCGFTDEIVRYIANRLTEIGIEYDLTRRGTIRAKLPGGGDGPARAIVNHVDTIGAMVRMVRSDGRIQITPIGYWSSRFAEGVRVTLFSERKMFRGTLLPVLNWGVSRDRGVEDVPLDWDHIELRIDEPVFNNDDVRKLGISVGDYIAVDSAPEVLDNGYIVGRNIEFEKDRQIVQQWYFGDQGEVSLVTLKLHPDPQGTSVELRHTNIPDEAYDDIIKGWNDVYFAALINFYEP